MEAPPINVSVFQVAIIYVAYLLYGCAPQTARLERSVESTRAWVTGTVAYSEPLALAPGARVHIVIEDVALADAPAAVIAEQVIQSPRQVPISFALPYDPASLNRTHEYAVQAYINDVDGRLLWVNGARYSVATLGNPSKIKVFVQSTRVFSFACDGLRFAARIVAKGVQLALPGRNFWLPQLPPESGTEYSDISVRFFWRKDDEALLEVDGQTYRDCRRVSDGVS
jgi:putative lipoprotein